MTPTGNKEIPYCKSHGQKYQQNAIGTLRIYLFLCMYICRYISKKQHPQKHVKGWFSAWGDEEHEGALVSLMD